MASFKKNENLFTTFTVHGTATAVQIRILNSTTKALVPHYLPKKSK
jgi:hypothetical protein